MLPPDAVDDGQTSPGIVFQSPSYSQQAENRMAALHNFQPAISTVNLANNTSGTTFAARARAAELNAVRARRAAKESEMEDEVPAATPVALGALKFTRPRNRGKAWKAFNLDELREETSQDEDSTSERAKSPGALDPQLNLAKDYTGNDTGNTPLTSKDVPNLQVLFKPTFSPGLSHQESLNYSQSVDPEKWATNQHVTGWDPAMSANPAGDEGHMRASSNHFASKPPSRAPSASSNLRSGQMQDTATQGSSTPSLRRQATNQLEAENVQHQQRLNSLEERRLKKLGVLPALKPVEVRSYLHERNHEDPFTEASRVQSNLYGPYAAEPRFTSSSSSAVRAPPLAVKGTLNQDFRFPQASQTRHGVLPQPSIPKSEQGQTNVPTGPKANTYQRDPMPYSGFSASSKKDLLLRNLHDVVESSKTQGSLPTSTRTVLYDPVAHDSGKTVQPSPSEAAFKRAQDTLHSHALPGTGPMAPSKVNKELLKVSDPLPWSDRPVSIHDSTSPTSPRTDFTAPSPHVPTTQMPPPGFGFGSPDIWSFAPQDRRAARSLEEVESWWTSGSRRYKELEDLTTSQICSNVGGQNANPIDITVTSNDGRTRDGNKDVGLRLNNNITTDGEIAARLMLPALRTLASYGDGAQPDYFHRFARVPEWCIDKSQGGDRSFFGDWGVPPSRVGRDPRYRPTFHEGRYTVFEELDRRGGRDGLTRRYG